MAALFHANPGSGAYLSGDPTEATFCPAAVATFVLRVAVVAGQVVPFFFFEHVAALATVSAFVPRR